MDIEEYRKVLRWVGWEQLPMALTKEPSGEWRSPQGKLSTINELNLTGGNTVSLLVLDHAVRERVRDNYGVMESISKNLWNMALKRWRDDKTGAAACDPNAVKMRYYQPGDVAQAALAIGIVV